MPEGHKIGQPAPLIREIKADEIKALKEKYAGRSKSASPTKPVSSSGSNSAPQKEPIEDLEAKVSAQGDAVRKLKESKAEKSVIKEAVDQLLALKKDLALAQGKDPNEVIGGGNKKGKKK